MIQTRLDERIAKLEAELKNAKAKKGKEKRQERNNQLMAFGIMLETKYKSLNPEEREKIKSWVAMLDERNKERVLSGFTRLENIS